MKYALVILKCSLNKNYFECLLHTPKGSYGCTGCFFHMKNATVFDENSFNLDSFADM